MRLLNRYAVLLLLAGFSILGNGYHYSADDGAIYVPEIIAHLHPSLYPANAAFFQAHGSLSVFPILACGLARILGGSIPWALLLLQFFGIFLLLASSFRLAELMFVSRRAAWGAVCLLAGTISLFVAGTSIPIMDPYFTARTLSTPIILLAFSSVVSGQRLLAILSIGIAFLLHPLMAVFALMLIAGYYIAGLTLQMPARVPIYASVLPLGLGWGRVQEPYRQTMESRTFFFASRWSGVEWVGVFVPLAIFSYMWRIPIPGTRPALRRICGGCFLSGGLATIFFLAVSLSPNLETFVRLQPMRAFQPIYIVLFLIVGGFIGEHLLRASAWRWVALLLILGAMDVAIDRAAYPDSAHVEWPTSNPINAWEQGFLWVKLHTPQDALFALPPDYMHAPGEDMHGFRGIAERSALADQIKDSGVVSMFPELAPEWRRQIDAQAGWNSFTAADFHRLATSYQVSWVIVENSRSRGLDCRYHNAQIAVCHVA